MTAPARRGGARPLLALLAGASWLYGTADAEAASAPVLLDDFSDASLWQAQGSDDVSVAAHPIEVDHRKGLCLEFDLAGTAGYASLRRALPLTPLANYEFRLTLRGDAPANDFQLKLSDASGENVWWHRRADFALPHRWQTLAIGRDAISFAWGPAKDHELGKSASLELTVAAGHGGGHGSVCFARLELVALGPTSKAAAAPADPLARANEVLSASARAAPRGHFPRALVGEQNYWTVIGLDGGPEQALLSEDGTIEPRRGGWSLEPFLLDQDQVVTWADAKIEQRLEDNYLPLPSVRWETPALALEVAPFAAAAPGGAEIVACYTVTNPGKETRRAALALALRPIQVNPPTQFLNAAGGASLVHALDWNGEVLSTDGATALRTVEPPTQMTIGARVDVAEQLRQPPAGKRQRARDPGGLASALLLYRFELAGKASRTIDVRLPLGAPHELASLASGDAAATLSAQRAAAAADWRAQLNRVGLRLPESAAPLADTLRTALAHVLIERNGPALQPGVRSYARSWIRDGAMMSEALLRLGHGEEARAYAEWFGAHLFKNGKVPCCVDYRGSDPTPENDSAGEFVWLVAEVFRYERDRDFLARMWPGVQAAMAYLERLRQSERGAANRTPERTAYFGLLPPSISHEGYSAKPAYSYWDDFWAFAGYEAAHEIALALGEAKTAAEFGRARDEFARELGASIAASAAQHQIDYLPGAADLGDFDATSSTIALSPAGFASRLPPGLVTHTFERYWQEFLTRRYGARLWDAYTPYEWRTVGSFVRLGWRERAQELSDFFLSDRRPLAWNQWAEVIGREPRTPRFVGDMPHGWVASDFIRSTLDRFAYERDVDHVLVLAAGVPSEWLGADGIGIEGLPTPYGMLSYRLHEDQKSLVLRIAAGTAPPGGFEFSWPHSKAPGATRVDGKLTPWHDGKVKVDHAPAEVVVALRRGRE